MIIKSKICVVKHARRANVTKCEYHEMQRKIARDLLQRELLEYGIDYSNEEILTNSYGKPYFAAHKDVHYNVSNCNGAVAVCISRSETGIDIEDIKLFRLGVADRICTVDEKKYIVSKDCSNESFFRIWTLKEAYMKAIGMGFAYSPQKVSFEIDNNNIKIVSENEQNATIRQIKLTGGYILSYCSLNNSDEELMIEVIGGNYGEFYKFQ